MKKISEARAPSRGHIALRPRKAFGGPVAPEPGRGTWGVFRVLRAHLNIDFSRAKSTTEEDES